MIQNINVKDLIANHEKEVSAMIDEMNQLKTIVSQMSHELQT